MRVSSRKLLAGVALDLILGDQQSLPHPVRGIGKIASVSEKFWRGTMLSLRFVGAMFWLTVVGATVALVRLSLPWADVYWIYSFLACHNLDQQAGHVISALERVSIQEARRKLSRIVGRDTAHLNELEIMRAATETVAENLSDGVVAPLFYLLLAGPLGMAAYKAVNTLDSMVGYRNQRYREFGWASAHMDDLANYLPARSTAVLIWISAFLCGLNVRRSIQGEITVTVAAPVFSEFHRAFPQAQLAELRNPETWPTEGLLVLTRPANPTGWTLDLAVLQDWLRAARNLVLIDESFLEFSNQPSAAVLLDKHPQLIILRSLTKFYALPGLRIGSLIGAPEKVRLWQKQREPWQINVLAQAAALAALADQEHARKTLELVRTERQWLLHELKLLSGVQPVESDANFLYVRVSCSPRRITEHLLRQKILVRDCTDWPGLSEQALRIAVRTRRENERLIEAWRSLQCE